MKTKPKGKRPPRDVFKWGYLTLEVFDSHKEVILTRRPLGSENTIPERVFMSKRGFTHLAKQFLKEWAHPKKRER